MDMTILNNNFSQYHEDRWLFVYTPYFWWSIFSCAGRLLALIPRLSMYPTLNAISAEYLAILSHMLNY